MAADHLRLACDLREAGERTGQTADQVIASIQRQCDVSALRAHRLYAGLTAEALAKELGVSRTQVLKWEIGTHRPEYSALDVLCRVLRTNPVALGLFADYRDELSPITDPAGGTVGSRHHAHDGEDPTNRRSLLAGLAAAPLVEALERLRGGTDQLLSETSVTQASLADWQDAADTYHRKLLTTATDKVLPDLGADYAEITSHLRRRQPIDTQRDLSHVATRYATLIAMAFSNLGEQRAERRWWATATALAEESGDSMLRALVLARRTMRGLYEREPLADVIAHARRVERLAGRPCEPLVEALAIQAQALALLGNTDAAEKMLRNKLAPAFTQLPAEVVRDEGIWTWPVYRLHFVESFVYSLSGRSRDARNAQEQALRLFPAGHYANRTQIELHRAVLAVREGDPTEGATYATTILHNLAAPYRVGMVMATATLVLGAMPENARKLPRAVELSEFLDAAGKNERKSIT